MQKKTEAYKKAAQALKGIQSFDEYFKGYKNYDNGGVLDQKIVADAKKVYQKLRTPDAIQEFYRLSSSEQYEKVPGLDRGHSGASFGYVCWLALKYAKYVNEKEQKSNFVGWLWSMRSMLMKKSKKK
jgi:hypothetical protein